MKKEKDQMIAIINRCRAIIEGEAELLKSWSHMAGMEPGRIGDALRSIRTITCGETSALAQVDNIINKASDLDDNKALHTPHEKPIELLEADLKQRQTWDGPTLSDRWYEIALDRSEDNASHAADSAGAAFEECVS